MKGEITDRVRKHYDRHPGENIKPEDMYMDAGVTRRQAYASASWLFRAGYLERPWHGVYRRPVITAIMKQVGHVVADTDDQVGGRRMRLVTLEFEPGEEKAAAAFIAELLNRGGTTVQISRP